MPRRVDATEHLLDEVRRRVPVQFKLVSGSSIPSVGEADIAFWVDRSNPSKPVAKIVMRAFGDRYIFSSAKESVAVGSGQVLVTEDETQGGYLDDQIAVSLPLTKSVSDGTDGDQTLNLGFDPSAVDHGSLGGLGDDDHAQYALLAGRSGGQTLYGGTGSSETLTLQSTADSTQGTLYLEPNAYGRVVLGNQDYDPYVSNNKYSGRFFCWSEEAQGPNSPVSVLHVAQKTTSTGGYPYALSVAQRIFTDARGSALFTNAQFQSNTSTSLARALYAYVSVGGSASPNATEVPVITARAEVSNTAQFTTVHGVQSIAACYGSGKITTFNAFEASVPTDTQPAGFTDVRGLHVGDMGATATATCDSILVDAQDDGFDGLSGNIRMAGGDWNNGHLQLGSGHFWATSGDLRFSRSTPAGATDYDFAVLASTVDFATRRGVNLSDPTDAQDAATKAYVDSTTSSLDHGSLGGLSDDDHPQYALLAGRSGGQTLHGGSADSEDLILRSTAGSTPGHVHLADRGAEYATVGTKDTESVRGKLHVGASQSDGWRYGVKVQFEGDAATATWPDALKAEATLAGSSAQDGRGHTGVAGFGVLANNFSEPNSELRGMVAAVQTESGATSATLGLAIGLRAGVATFDSNTFNAAHAIEAKLIVADTSTMTTAIGVRVFTPDIASGATLSTVTGIQVDDLAASPSGGTPGGGDALLVASQSFSSASAGNLRLAGGGWNTGHLQLGSAHAWSSSGAWRFGTAAPSSDSDYAFAIGATIDFASRRGVNLADPVDAQDAATKAYVDAHSGGGGLSDAYAAMTDGTNTASASGSDTFKFRSANDRLTIAVTNDDATHGDNALFTLVEGNIVHQNLSGAGAHDHADLDSHVDSSSGVHGVTGSVVGTTDTQTLTNKTLTSPSLTDASLSGTTSVSNTLSVSAAATFSSTVDASGTVTLTGSLDAGDASSVEIPSAPGGTTLSNTGEICVDTTGYSFKFHDGTGTKVLNPLRRFTVTIEDPSDSEDITLTHFKENSTLEQVTVVVRGSSPSVTFNLRYDTNRTNAGTAVWTSDKTASSTTTGDDWTSFDNDSIGADRFLWLTTSATSGTVTEMCITIYYRQTV